MNSLLVITLVLSLAACNGEELAAPTTTTKEPTTTKAPTTNPTTTTTTKAPTTTTKAPTTTTKAPTTTTKAPTTTTKAPTTTTKAPTTTTKAPTTTTKAPTTTTKAPTTTTKAPTTTPGSQNTTLAPTTTPVSQNTTLAPTTTPVSQNTTLAPTTTPVSQNTTLAPTTTPVSQNTTLAPTTATPTGDPTKLNFTLQAKNKSCIYLLGKINIEMLVGKNKTTHALTQTGVNITGSCPPGNGTSRLSLAWESLTLVFAFNQTTDLWFLNGLVVQALASDQKTLRTASRKYGPGENSGLFQAKPGFSYSCPTDKKLVLESPKNTSYTITVDFVSVRMQPFQGKPFDKDSVCPGKDDDKKSSSVVPIAVGGALAGLIVIVLIAYLIGRRKANRGYQKV